MIDKPQNLPFKNKNTLYLLAPVSRTQARPDV